MPNLVSLARPSLQILAKTQTKVFPILILVIPYKRNSDDIDMKFGPVTELDKKSKITSKELTMTSCQQIVTLPSFCQVLANLEHSGSWIPDREFVNFAFSILVAFYLTKTENGTKISQTLLSQYCFE